MSCKVCPENAFHFSALFIVRILIEIAKASQTDKVDGELNIWIDPWTCDRTIISHKLRKEVRQVSLNNSCSRYSGALCHRVKRRSGNKYTFEIASLLLLLFAKSAQSTRPQQNSNRKFDCNNNNSLEFRCAAAQVNAIQVLFFFSFFLWTNRCI